MFLYNIHQALKSILYLLYKKDFGRFPSFLCSILNSKRDCLLFKGLVGCPVKLGDPGSSLASSCLTNMIDYIFVVSYLPSQKEDYTLPLFAISFSLLPCERL